MSDTPPPALEAYRAYLLLLTRLNWDARLAGKLESMLEASHWNIWTFLIFTSVVPGVILLALTPVLKKMGHGRI